MPLISLPPCIHSMPLQPHPPKKVKPTLIKKNPKPKKTETKTKITKKILSWKL